ncbi:MAG: MarR family winged helix-turn-helix transcriptional regulator [Acidiferrobacter sp.]
MDDSFLLEFLEAAHVVKRQVTLLLADAGLTWAQFRLLRAMATEKECTAHTLSIRLRVSKPSITGLLHDAQQRDLIETRDHPTDGRSILVALAPLGHRRLDIALQNIAAMTAAMPPPSRRMTAALKDLAQGRPPQEPRSGLRSPYPNHRGRHS